MSSDSRARRAREQRARLAALFDEVAAVRGSGLALAAVGSLARDELGPRSDLDLVLLHTSGMRARDLAATADAIWYPLWDKGIRLDHSVRTLAECRSVAHGDLSAAVGLLDLTHVAGDELLTSAVRSGVARDWRANARSRLDELRESVAQRHARHGDLAHLVEPDLKEARGGLRDMQVLRALTAAWLADRPHGRTDAAHETLLDVRDALHGVTGRGRDRLLRDDQGAVAEQLGLDADGLLAGVSGAARTISYALDVTMRRATQSQRARALRVRPRRPQLHPLGHGLHRHDGEVVIGARPRTDDPLLPLRAAVVAARNRLPLSPSTLESLAACDDLPTPWPPMAQGLLTDLLATGEALPVVWEGLEQVGLVTRWLPAWADVRHRPQRSPVHRHTVDRHLVETVVRLQPRLGEHDRPDLLLLAGLLHDIGKTGAAHADGQPEDHSAVGAPIARGLMERMGFDEADIAVVERLVREHLTLVELATRRDPEDAGTVGALLEAVGHDAGVLRMLAALTEADATAAGPKAWTQWRAHLVGQLTARALGALEGIAGAAPQEPTVQSYAAAGGSGAAGGALASADGAASAVTDGAAAAPADRLDAHERPHVLVAPLAGAFRVEVLEDDRPGLFADTATLLGAAGLVIRSATVRTVGGLAVDEWVVESPSGSEPDAAYLRRGLLRAREGGQAPAPRPRVREDLPPPRVLLAPGEGTGATVIEVRCPDRPGLLRDAALGIAAGGGSIRSAHVATHAGQALDTFYVTGAQGGPLEPPEAARVVRSVMAALGG